MAKVKVGVIGVGIMGNFHTKIASNLKECSLVGIYDASPERAAEISALYNCKAFASIDELMAKADAAILASPTPLHFELCKNLLEKGKDVLVEKPLTQYSKTSSELASLSRQKNVVLAVGMIERFNPAFVKVLSLIRKEKILGIDIKRWSPYPQRMSNVSVVWDMMIHDLDLALLLGKSAVSSVKAKGKKTKNSLMDEAEATIYFKDGAIANISGSRAKNDKLRHIKITTEHAIYDVNLLAKKLYKSSYENLIDKAEIEVKNVDQLTAEQRDFYSAIVNKKDPNCSGEEAAISIKLAEEVEQLCSGQ